MLCENNKRTSGVVTLMSPRLQWIPIIALAVSIFLALLAFITPLPPSVSGVNLVVYVCSVIVGASAITLMIYRKSLPGK